jgi:dihydropteroate synthase
MIDMIMQKEKITTPASERLPGTLVLHTEAVRNGASIVRCHDVKEHFQSLRVFEEIRQFDV